MKRRSRESGARERPGVVLAAFVMGFVAVLATSLATFPRIGDGVFFSWDSALYAADLNELVREPLALHVTAAYTQSLGNYPTHPTNYKLAPEAILGLKDGRIDGVRMFVWTALFFFAATYAVAMVFGLGPWIGSIGGVALTFLVLPFTSPPAYTEVYWWHAPHWIQLLYGMAAFYVSFFLIGRLRGSLNLIPVFVFGGLIIWEMVALPKATGVVFPWIAVVASMFTLFSETRREATWKIGGGGAIAAFMALAGPLDFVRGVYAFATNSIFFEGIAATGATDWRGILGNLFYAPGDWIEYFWHSLVWVRYHIGYPLTASSLLGAAYVLLFWRGNRAAKALALTVLVSFPYGVVFKYGSAIPGGNYHVLVLFTVALAAAMQQTLARIWRTLTPPWLNLGSGRGSVRLAAMAALFAVAAGTLMLDSSWQVRPGGYPYPPARLPVIEAMEREIRFAHGDRFRGRFVNQGIMRAIDAKETPPADTASAFIAAASTIGVANGNDLTFGGVRYFDIPATAEVNRMSTPVSMLFFDYLLVRPGSIERIDYRVVSKFDPRILALIGVRFVLSHEGLAARGARLADAAPLPKSPQYRLYELAEPNLGQYSPLRIERLDDFAGALRRLDDPSFDPRATAIVHDGWAGDPRALAPARRVAITRIPGGLHIEAESDGEALAVLPFEFSRCLDLRTTSPDPAPAIGRVNLMLTGLHFTRRVDATLKFRYGPFHNPRCRLDDTKDIQRMGLNTNSFAAFQKENPDRLVFTGLY